MAQLSAHHQASLDAAIKKVRRDIRNRRPRSTVKLYEAKQLRWTQWCETEAFVDGDTVSEEKLMLFLMNEVIPRGHLKKPNTTIGIKTLEANVNAAVDLYTQQTKAGTNGNAHPRGDDVRDLLTLHKDNEVQRLDEGFVNRTTRRLENGYTDDQKLKLCREWLSSGSFSSLRTHVDFLLGHSSLARSDTKRALQYADMFSTLFPGEGPTECRAVVIASREGKTNKTGNWQYNAAIRSRDPVCCAVGAVALYLFSKWQGEEKGEHHQFPSFEHPRNWYNSYFLSASDSGKEMAYATQDAHIKRGLVAVGVNSTKVTHITRGSGARLAEAAGVPEGEIRRTGHWNEDTMQSVYLGKLARETIRALAGHPRQGGGYWIPRANIEPSDRLKQKIFPRTDYWIKNVEARQSSDLAALSFLELLQYLRVVLLQDAALLMDAFPSSSAWNHHIFADPEFLEFKARVQEAEKETQDPSETPLRSILPDLSRLIEVSFAQVKVQMAEISSRLGSIDTRMSALEGHSGQQVEAQRMIRATQHIVSAHGPRMTTSTINPTGETETLINARRLDESAVTPSPAPTSNPVTSTRALTSSPPEYRLDRNLRTVADVWTEYIVGLPGRPAVRNLEAKFKNKWRQGDAESRFFRRRRELYRAVTAISKARKIATSAAADLLDEYARKADLSLDKLRLQILTATQRLSLDT